MLIASRLDAMRLWILLSCFFSLGFGQTEKSQTIIFDTAPSLVEAGADAFRKGHFANAAKAFIALERYYGEEHFWKEGKLAQRILPVAGFAALKAGMFEESIHFLGQYLENHAEGPADESFALYSLAVAKRRQGDAQKAISLLAELRGENPTSAIGELAKLQEALLRLESGEDVKGLALLEELTAFASNIRIQTQARLAAIHYSIKQEAIAKAASYLLENRWQIDSMPELAQLSMLAMEIGDWAASLEFNDKALKAYRHVISKNILVSKQQKKIGDFENKMNSLRKDLTLKDALWIDFYGGVISSAKKQLNLLAETEDYEDALLLRKGQSYLQADRLLEAWLVFERLFGSSDEEIRKEAHYRWALTAKEAGACHEAIVIAQEFLDLYPNSSDIWQVTYLIGLTYIENRQYGKAITTLESLLTNSTDKSKQALALYQLGYCYAQKELFSKARDRFAKASEVASSPLEYKAKLWIGLCWFFESEFKRALEQFQDLRKTDSVIAAEAKYRAASCYYAMQHFPKALVATENYLKVFPLSERTSEAWLLLGSIQQSMGKFEAAIQSFARLFDSEESLAHTATMQSVDCYLALRQPLKAAKILNTTLSKWKIADHYFEASTMLAELEKEAGRLKESKRIAWAAVEKFGNYIESERALDMIIKAASLESSHIDSKTILEERHTGALANNRLVQACRLELAQHLFLTNGEAANSNAGIIEMAQRYEHASIPPEGLAYIGYELLSFGSIVGAEMLERLINKYPRNHYTNFGYYGLAKDAYDKKELRKALGLLLLIDETAPVSSVLQKSSLLKADTYAALNLYEDATREYEAILKQRGNSGELKAKALLGLGDLKEKQSSFKQANAYYQRVYSLYPAYTDIAAACYVRSARLLGKLDLKEEALATLKEFLNQERYRDTDDYEKGLRLAEAIERDVEKLIAELGEEQI